MDRAIVLYDEGCGFCRWSMAKVLAWDRRRRLRPLPLGSAEAGELLGDLEPERRAASWHLVAPDGRRHSGGDAVAPMLRLLPGGAPLAALASAAPGATRVAYRWVSRHRGRLGRILGERACAVDPVAARDRRRSP
jgi:predicted DCC family thiol-disulfide oxidoreductase YuxK